MPNYMVETAEQNNVEHTTLAKGILKFEIFISYYTI